MEAAVTPIGARHTLEEFHDTPVIDKGFYVLLANNIFLQNLLRERVAIRDLETILETLGEWAPRTKDTDVLTEYVRNALARSVCQMYKDDHNVIRVVTLDPKVEDLVNAHVERNDRGAFLNMPPDTQNRLADAVRAQLEQGMSSAGGQTIAVLCSPQVRTWIRRIIEPVLAHVPVLAYNEIVRGIEVRSLGLVVLADDTENLPE